MSRTTVATRGMLFCLSPPMKRLSRSLLALAGFGTGSALAPVSCARREAPAPSAAPLSLHLLGDPATLDPTAVTEEEELRVVSMMFRPLVGSTASSRPCRRWRSRGPFRRTA